MEKKTAQEMVDQITDFVNVYGFDKEGFKDGIVFAKEELVEKISQVDGLDPWTIDKICEMIEGNEI